MSLKSFDKFCETIITAEPGSQKIIYDERQRQVRSKINTESLLVYVFATFVNTAVMEGAYKWCESFVAPMALTAALCYIYWLLRCHFSGALFGINGTAPAKWAAGVLMLQTFCWCVMFFSDVADEGGVFHDGVLSSRFVTVIAFLIFFIGAAVNIVLAKKAEKAEKEKAEEKS